MTHAFTCDLCAHTGVFGFRLFGERTTCLDEAACAGRIEDDKKQTARGSIMTRDELGAIRKRDAAAFRRTIARLQSARDRRALLAYLDELHGDIDRLSGHRAAHQDCIIDRAKVEAERDRLRETLRDIAIAKGCDGYGEVLGGKLMEIARKSLEGT